MPKLLAAKPYPALVDVYHMTSTQPEGSLEIVREWHYDEPFTYECNFMSLTGHGEKFGVDYTEKDLVKIEVKPQDAKFINLGMRFGNVRMKNQDSEQYYAYVGDRIGDSNVIDYYFNIDSINPQVDNNGRIVCVEIYGKLA
jgi:hypothetical protein